MTNRTTQAYESVFEYIHNFILPLNGKGIITDFEQALRNGLKNVVPDTPLYGCWFHHCQALRRKLASIPKLFEISRNDRKIKDSFDQLAYEALQNYPEFADFVKYYDAQWIRKVTPDGFSVFLQVI